MSQKKFAELKDWKKKALYLSVHEGMNGAQIARKLSISERTVQDNLKKLLPKIDLDEIMNPDGETYVAPVNRPKVLFWDIETALAIAYHWGHWKQNISMKQKMEESHLISHAWAWGDGDVEGSILTAEEMIKRDPERLVHEVWKLLDEADVVVAHNGKNFDIKMVNAYFLKYGLPPPSPYKVLDTYIIAKKKFRLDFNSLAWLAHYLGVEVKLDSGGVDTWIGCSKGIQEDIDKMLWYNKGDITTLREVYYKLVAWDNDGVNFGLYNHTSEMACPHCGSGDVAKVKGKGVYTAQRKYQMYRCQNCKAPLRSNEIIGTKNRAYRVIN